MHRSDSCADVGGRHPVAGAVLAVSVTLTVAVALGALTRAATSAVGVGVTRLALVALTVSVGYLVAQVPTDPGDAEQVD